MQFVLTNLDSVVFALPLLALLFPAFFRVDELMSKPMKPVVHRRQVSGLDSRGIPMCLDPDGRMPRRMNTTPALLRRG